MVRGLLLVMVRSFPSSMSFCKRDFQVAYFLPTSGGSNLYSFVQPTARAVVEISKSPTVARCSINLLKHPRKSIIDIKTAEAHSSLSAILFRLNAGFVSVIERFTKGRSTSGDYQALLNLSNASRMEAINTFEQLSHRLSRSSLALVPSPKHRPHQRKRKTSTSREHLRHSHSKSAPELSVTPLGPADKEGWVRPKHGRKLSSDSRSCKASGSRRSTPKQSTSRESSKSHGRLNSQPRRMPAGLTDRVGDRKSFMSFATDSTKLGEIPEHKWARPTMVQAGKYPITTYYPLEPYQEPEKQKSRFMRFFGRGND